MGAVLVVEMYCAKSGGNFEGSGNFESSLNTTLLR